MRVKVWCQLHGKTQKWIGDQIGKSKQEVDNVAAGRYRSGDVVDGVARTMGVSVDWLLYGAGTAPEWWEQVIGEQTMPEHVAESGAYSMPWCGIVTAGGGWAMPSQDNDDTLPVTFKPHWRLVRVQGTSAHPILLSGQAAIVDDQLPVRDGRMVCVQTKDGRAYLKRWNTVGDHIVLAGLNSGVDSTVLHRDDIASVGVVVGTLYVDSVAK